MNDIFGATFDHVERAMHWRVARQSLLSGNVANADTPGYRRFDLAMDAALEDDGLARSDGDHLSTRGIRPGANHIERGEFGDRPDRNGVDLDQELLELSRNAGQFNQQAELLSRLLALRRVAITGEAR